MKLIAVAILTVMVIPALAEEHQPVVIYDDVIIQIPLETRVKGRDGPIDWKEVRALTELMPDGGPITLLAGDGIELEIGVSESAEYVQNINRMSRLEWLTFQTQMLQAQIMDVRSRSTSSAAMASGDRLGSHRVLMARSSWQKDKKLHNLLVFDVFHATRYIGLTFLWTGSEGSSIERRVDEIASSIESAN